MGGKKRKWSLRRKALVWGAIAATILAILLFGLRGPWITPVSGVSVEMTRPPIGEGDLGLDSAYRLLLAALTEIGRPETPSPVRNGFPGAIGKLPTTVTQVRVWSGCWTEALEKLVHHPWPTAPPPPAPPSNANSPSMDDMAGAWDAADPHALAIRREAPWTLEQYRKILHGLALHGRGLPLLDRALAVPAPQVPVIDAWRGTAPRQRAVGNLCAWLVAAAHVHATAGDYAAARRDLQRSLATAALITRGGLSADHAVAWEHGGRASTAARTIAVRFPVPVAILRRMVADFLHQADSVEPFVECVRADLLPLRNFVPIYYSSALYHPAVDAHHWGSKGGRFLRRLAAGAAPVAGSTPGKTVRNLESLYQHWVVLAQKPYSATVQDEYDAIKKGWSPERTILGLVLATRDPVGYHMAGGVIDTTDQLHARATTHVAVLRGTALFLAVRAYETEHGALPDSLAQLVPAYLPRLPADPFSGKPFRYLRSGVPGLPGDAWAIYSVGANCADDSGTAYIPSSFSPYCEPDLVIPSQNYPREWQLKKPPREWHPGGRSKPRVGPRLVAI